MVVDVEQRRAFRSKRSAVYSQPERFDDHALFVSINPHAGLRMVRWTIPEDLSEQFVEFEIS